MSHHALAAIENLILTTEGYEEQLVLDKFCNKLRFNPQLNRVEIAVEDLILQDEDIEVFLLTTEHSLSLKANCTQLYFQNKDNLSQFQSWLNQYIDSFKIY